MMLVLSVERRNEGREKKRTRERSEFIWRRNVLNVTGRDVFNVYSCVNFCAARSWCMYGDYYRYRLKHSPAVPCWLHCLQRKPGPAVWVIYVEVN